MSIYPYDPKAGATFARSYALYDHVPKDGQLFFYDPEDDCTNFVSQCVWAAYGGWIPGYTDDRIGRNKLRIKKDIRQVTGIWFGSAGFIGSNKWCRVEEFHGYVVTSKTVGPSATLVAQGRFSNVNPAAAQVGDVIQMVVASYTPDRYGHSLYVTKSGVNWEDVQICCHSIDRMDAPMTTFTQFPDTYRKLRILRFSEAEFSS